MFDLQNILMESYPKFRIIVLESAFLKNTLYLIFFVSAFLFLFFLTYLRNIGNSRVILVEETDILDTINLTKDLRS